ncbi:unnamed protein product, partial [Closterium sp. Naga37s-1]
LRGRIPLPHVQALLPRGSHLRIPHLLHRPRRSARHLPGRGSRHESLCACVWRVCAQRRAYSRPNWFLSLPLPTAQDCDDYHSQPCSRPEHIGCIPIRRHHLCRLHLYCLHNLECCLIVLFPYISYLVAEGLALSGIVAILFCGILMKRYTFPNLSEVAQVLSAGFFQLIASIAETFTFIYMGTEIALGEHQRWGHISFIFFSIIFIGVARAANVFPCAHLINLFRPPSKQIPDSHQKALWFSGLRGAMAFGLALQATHDLPNHSHGRAIFTTTTAIVMVTVILLGGSTSTVLERLRVTGDRYSQLRQPDDTSDEEEEEGSGMMHGLIDAHEDTHGSARGHGHGDGRGGGRGGGREGGRGGGEPNGVPFLPQKLESADAYSQHHVNILPENPSFEDLDSKYIRPFFTAEPAPDTRRREGGGADRGSERGRGGGVGGGVEGGVEGGKGVGGGPGGVRSPQITSPQRRGDVGGGGGGGLSGSLLERRSSFRSGSPTSHSAQRGSGGEGGSGGLGGGSPEATSPRRRGDAVGPFGSPPDKKGIFQLGSPVPVRGAR